MQIQTGLLAPSSFYFNTAQATVGTVDTTQRGYSLTYQYRDDYQPTGLAFARLQTATPPMQP